jgi:hypothetical protein
MLTYEQDLHLKVLKIVLKDYSREQMIEEIITCYRYAFELRNRVEEMAKIILEGRPQNDLD